VFDEATLLDAPDVDGAHGERPAGRRVTEEIPGVRAFIAIPTHHARPVGRDEDVFRGDLEVGNARDDGREDLLGTFQSGLGECVVVHVVRRLDLVEAGHVVGGHDLGKEVAELGRIGKSSGAHGSVL